MEIKYLVDRGQKRKSNQDFAAIFTNEKHQTLAIVADGMGGHLAGDVASKMATTELGESFQQTAFHSSEEATRWFIQTLQKVNEDIFQKGQSDSDFFGMGTTIVAVVVFEDEFVLAHVGDSRAYLLKENTLRQITVDHSLVQELVNEGEITQEMARVHPRKNVVTRSVGMPGTLEVDVLAVNYTKPEELLLCSDGLTNMVEDSEILEILQTLPTTEEKVATLVEKANAAGGLDNITVLLIDFGKGDTHD